MLESVFGIHPTILLELLTIPLFTGIIGYITNWTGVLMLFRPIAFHGVRLPGLRPHDHRSEHVDRDEGGDRRRRGDR